MADVRALVHLYSPPYLISALAALRSLHPAGEARATVVVHLPGASEPAAREIAGVVRELAANHPLIESVVGLHDSGIGDLNDRLGAGYTEFLYSHDATGQLCRRLANLYPSARRVCIGDGFGMIYPADFIARYHRTGVFRYLAAMLGLRRELPPLKPQVAALALPVDPSGEGLRGVERVPVGGEEFRAAIAHCHAQAQALRAYMSGLLERYAARRRYLLLTENYAESGFLSAERENAMYADMVRAHCAAGSVVLIKPHPLESPGKLAKLKELLGANWEIVELEARFRRHPIEIWDELVLGCTVLCSGYPVLSLKYAHGIDVVQPMNERFIERWIEPRHRAWVRDGQRLYMEPLARLPQWDGRSVLWSGGATR